MERRTRVRTVGDTTVDAEAVRIAAIRARSPADRLRDALDLSEVVHAAVIQRRRERYPQRTMVELALMEDGGPGEGASAG